MKKILILVAGESNLPFIQAAKNLGLYVITCDNNASNPGHKLADKNLYIDVYDHKSIIEALKDENIDGVMSFVSSHGLNSAAIISDYYNLKGYTPNAIKTLNNKGLFRDFLSINNLNFPAYQCVQNLEEIDLDMLNYPVIIKPTDKGGSQGVIKINNENELFLNFQVAKETSDSGTVIVEEFIEGEALINGDCLIFKGEIICNMIGNYIYDNETNKVLPIATVFPTEHNTSQALKQIISIISKLKIPDGIINFEAIIRNKIPYIVEINPRPSGNYIWKLMGYKYNFDVPTFLLNTYLNSKNDESKPQKSNENSYAYQLIYTDKKQIFKGFEIPSTMEKNILDMTIFKQKNEYITRFENLFDRIGLLLLEFKNEKIRKFYIENTKEFKI